MIIFNKKLNYLPWFPGSHFNPFSFEVEIHNSTLKLEMEIQWDRFIRFGVQVRWINSCVSCNKAVRPTFRSKKAQISWGPNFTPVVLAPILDWSPFKLLIRNKPRYYNPMFIGDRSSGGASSSGARYGPVLIRKYGAFKWLRFHKWAPLMDLVLSFENFLRSLRKCKLFKTNRSEFESLLGDYVTAGRRLLFVKGETEFQLSAFDTQLTRMFGSYPLFLIIISNEVFNIWMPSICQFM